MLSYKLLHGVAATALVFTAACSSDGHFALGANTGLGGSGAHASNDTSGGAGANTGGTGSGTGGSSGAGAGDQGTTSNDSESGGTVSRTAGAVNDTLATAGNVGTLLTQSGGAGHSVVGQTSGVAQTADNAANPVARANVGDSTVLGSGAPTSSQALGVSALSPTQTHGDVATVGVLANGQVASASTNVAQSSSGNTLVGAAAGNQQVIGGHNDAIGASALAPSNAQGSAASVNVLSNGQVANAQVASPQTNGQTSGVATVLNGVLPH